MDSFSCLLKICCWICCWIPLSEIFISITVFLSSRILASLLLIITKLDFIYNRCEKEMNFMKLQGNLTNACPWEFPTGCQRGKKKKNPTCHISKHRMLQSSSHHAITLQLPRRWTLRELRIETGCPVFSSQPLLPPRWGTQRVRTRKHRILVPEGWGAHQMDDFSKPLHLPICREVLNSLTWDVLFSLINSDLVIFPLPGLCCKNSYISWLLPYLFGAVLMRGCILGLSSQFCLSKKVWFSTFRLWFFFF